MICKKNGTENYKKSNKKQFVIALLFILVTILTGCSEKGKINPITTETSSNSSEYISQPVTTEETQENTQENASEDITEPDIEKLEETPLDYFVIEGTNLISFSEKGLKKEPAIIKIPDTVTSIEGAAFRDCTFIKIVIFPDSVTSIGRCSFWGCEQLTDVILTENVKEIYNHVFYECKNLKHINLPETINILDWAVFEKCENLEEITLPKNITEISQELFAGCRKLKKIEIPNTVEKIGDFAFSGCYNLENFIIPDSVSWIGEYTFSNCRSIDKVTIPASVDCLQTGAFNNCSNLKEISFSNSVYLDDITLGNDNLTDIYFDGTSSYWKRMVHTIARGSSEVPYIYKDVTVHMTDKDEVKAVRLRENKVWKEQYINYINELKESTGNIENYKFDFAYINNDYIPEMLIQGTATCDGPGIIATYNENGIEVIYTGYSGTPVYYDEYGNLIYVIGGKDYTFIKQYQINDHKFEEVISGEYYWDYMTGNVNKSYWNKELVSYDEFKQKREELEKAIHKDRLSQFSSMYKYNKDWEEAIEYIEDK